ncbi:MAG: hypothetical protein WC785_00440 [Tatlockia sp.]|jgi:hypothetical protein
MLTGKNSIRYYLFSLANLIAAFGGGLILGKGIGVINSPYLHGGTILAFFIGTLLGLIFLQSIPERWSTTFANYFSVSGGITSLILLYIFESNSHNEQLYGHSAFLFFVFLSIRFGFWFYSRVMRASSAASSQHSVAWVEMGYYLGMVLGLIIWKLLNFHIDLGAALLLDACLQFTAGFLDFKSNKIVEAPSDEQIKITHITVENTSNNASLLWCWKLAGAVVFLTVAIQVVLFNAAHAMPDTVSSYLIATFYFGVAAAAFFCNRYQIRLNWDNRNFLAYLHSDKKKIKVRLSFMMLVSLVSVFFVVKAVSLSQNAWYLPSYLLCFFVLIAAFIFEIMSVVLLDRIGLEERKLNSSGMIMRTYGLMGVGAAVGFWLLGFMANLVESAVIILLTCFLFITANCIKRKEKRTLMENKEPETV